MESSDYSDTDPSGYEDTNSSEYEDADSCDLDDTDSDADDFEDLPPFEVRKILRRTTTVSLDKFCHAALGLSSDALDNWASWIHEHEWFNDLVISKNLAAFCAASYKHNVTRYKCLAILINRIMELGLVGLPGVADTYPIDDICTILNYPWAIRGVLNDEVVGDGQIPALITLRGRHAKLRPERPTYDDASDSGIHWAHIIMCWEVNDRPVQGGLYEKAKQAQLRRHGTRTSARVRAASRRASDHGISKEQLTQAASDALDMVQFNLSVRQFCINVILQADMIYLAYYDPCGCVCTSEGISLVTEFDKAAAIIVGIASCPPDCLGAPPSTVVKPPASAPHPAHWPPESLEGYTITLPHAEEIKLSTITLRDPWRGTYGLLGTRSTVYTVDSNKELTNKQLVAKIYCPISSRPSEESFIVYAREAGVGHLPEVHLAGSLWDMSDGARGVFHDTESAASQYRTLRAIVLTRYRPIDELLSEHPEYIPEMASQLLDCLHDLKEKADTLHRDIDVTNVVYEERNGKPYFILIDFDQAIDATDEEDSNPRRTRIRDGNGVFMAVDLMRVLDDHKGSRRKVAHYLRHDFESVFWLSLYCSAVFPAPKNEEEKNVKCRNEAVFEKWRTYSIEDVYPIKWFVRTRWWQKITLVSKAQFLKPWLDRWTTLWIKVEMRENERLWEEDRSRHGHGRRDSPLPPFDWETSAGLLTRDAIKRALSEKTNIDVMIQYGPRNQAKFPPPQARDSPNTSVGPSRPPPTTGRKRKAARLHEEEQTEYRRNRPKRDSAGRQKDAEPESQSGSGKLQRASQTPTGTMVIQDAGPRDAEDTRAKAKRIKSESKTKGLSTSGDEIGVTVAAKQTTVKRASVTKSMRKVATKTTAAESSKRSTAMDRKAKKLPTGDSRAKEGDGDVDGQPVVLNENDIRRRLRPRKRA